MNADGRAGGCGCGDSILVLKFGGWNEGEGMTSVSNDGITLFLEGITAPKPDERLETRAFLVPRATATAGL